MKEFQFKKPEKDKDPEIISEDPRITNNSKIIKLSLKIGFVQLMCGLGGIAAAACILNGIASLFELEMFTLHKNYKCVYDRSLICTKRDKFLSQFCLWFRGAWLIGYIFCKFFYK